MSKLQNVHKPKIDKKEAHFGDNAKIRLDKNNHQVLRTLRETR